MKVSYHRRTKKLTRSHFYSGKACSHAWTLQDESIPPIPLVTDVLLDIHLAIFTPAQQSTKHNGGICWLTLWHFP